MKKQIAILLCCLMLTGCGGKTVAEATIPATAAVRETVPAETAAQAPEYVSRFVSETLITLSDQGITTDGGDAVFASHDIVYYEDRDTYASGNPYGEGTDGEKHTAEEAAAHTVVNITQPGAYRIQGKLSAGQILVDLGNTAYYDPEAVVELILDGADITCTVAPAIVFRNVYECDGEWSVETAAAEVDTSAAGANLILEGDNTVSGSHVAKIFKDDEGEKKLWKQDGAIYSYMSLNVFGPGSLELTADNEGLDSELHLTIHGGNVHIASDNDGINTNEDGVSVTTINGGNLTIYAGLGEEGDGIDSNGYLVINGGSVVASANPKADAGLDSDLGTRINGGTVIAMGSGMDRADSTSGQAVMNLQFARQQKAGAKIVLTREDGTECFSFETEHEYARGFGGLILSHVAMEQGETYHLFLDGVQMAHTGTNSGMGKPDMSQMGQLPAGMEFPEGQMPQRPENMDPGARPQLPEGETMPGGFDPSQMDGREMGTFRPEGEPGDRTAPPEFAGEMPAMPEGEIPEGIEAGAAAEPSTEFAMQNRVTTFTGIQEA